MGLDQDTQFCIEWFKRHCPNIAPMDVGTLEEAQALARAENASIQNLVEAGVLAVWDGKVWLLDRSEYPDYTANAWISIWEFAHRLIWLMETVGEEVAANFCCQLGNDEAEQVRELARQMYFICVCKGWPEVAMAYKLLEEGLASMMGDKKKI